MLTCTRAHTLTPAVCFNEAAAACRAECEPERGLVYGATVCFFDSPALRLRRRALVMWDPGKPARVLIVKKPRDAPASAKLLEIAAWLEGRGIQVGGLGLCGVQEAAAGCEWPVLFLLLHT